VPRRRQAGFRGEPKTGCLRQPDLPPRSYFRAVWALVNVVFRLNHFDPRRPAPDRATQLVRFAAHTSAFGDPHQLRKTGLTPTSALVKLPTRRGSALFHPGARPLSTP
jgi:hypothetical protein